MADTSGQAGPDDTRGSDDTITLGYTTGNRQGIVVGGVVITSSGTGPLIATINPDEG
ncbi:hypothetical protein [Actinomadura verrucosospora]|uniref:Uncharacterized protein n=1 Tax=Actinomadura verrucosospora TaxID=46165 RepID=A0A7D3ZQ74_ACTVE|nr:hypothetical protein [Actinomadura verrucosospora]QKG24603.1 hypothetical protein ACTIVE_6252 [Actinomadura verrucosospora]